MYDVDCSVAKRVAQIRGPCSVAKLEETMTVNEASIGSCAMGGGKVRESVRS